MKLSEARLWWQILGQRILVPESERFRTHWKPPSSTCCKADAPSTETKYAAVSDNSSFKKKRNDGGRYEKLQIKFRAKKKRKEKTENASATTRACERERARNTNRGRPACRLQQRKKTTTSLDEKKFLIHPSEAIYSLALRKRPRENTDDRTMNDLFIHPSLHPCRTGWENEKTNCSSASCSLQQARMRRRRVWMRISFLSIHPNLSNSITVSKRPAGWRMPITDEPTMNNVFIHPSTHPYPTGCENGLCFESTSASENVKPGDGVFHPFFSFFHRILWNSNCAE